MLYFRIQIFLFAIILIENLAAEDQQHGTRFTIESRGRFTESLIQGLSKHKFSKVYQITPSVYIFEYTGNGSAEQVLQHLMADVFQDQIQAAEPTRNYLNAIKPVYTQTNGIGNNSEKPNVGLDQYYGMGVKKVWGKNITGKGVTLAINDIGIEVDLADLAALAPNINKTLCIDLFLFKNTSDVSPNNFTELVAEPQENTNHGNHVASVISAAKNNCLCSARIAFEATIVGIKMCQLQLQNETTFDYWRNATILSRKLTYRYDVIDIYVNAWAPVNSFDQLDLATRKAIESGATEGRHRLGAIHVVPTGPSANSLSNNIHTITVNGIPRYGEGLGNVNLDASVLVSGLRDGVNLTSSSMVTKVYGNKCVRTFKGLSAAVSQVSGIIALGLQANPDLTLRDVQHLLVRSSDHEQLDRSIHFDTNGALRKFNNLFGFGLVNADALVSMSLKHQRVSDLLSLELPVYKQRNSGSYTKIFDFCHSCNKYSSCVTSTEHVTLEISFATSAERLKIDLISPSGTLSSLMDRKFIRKKKLTTRGGKFVSVHFWDEVSFGEWHIKVQSKLSTDKTTVHNISLTLYGTDKPIKNKYAKHCGSGITNKTPDDDRDTTTKAEAWEFVAIIIITACVVFAIVIFSVCHCLCPSRIKMIQHVGNYSESHVSGSFVKREREKLPVTRNETDL